MYRRRLLRAVVTLGPVLAGCVGRPGRGDSPREGETPTASNRPDGTGTSSSTGTSLSNGASEPSRRSFTVLSRTCGNETNTAAVRIDTTVSVEGTVTGRDSCQTAHLESVVATEDRLEVVIETTQERSSGSVSCQQCLTEIQYRASFEFDTRPPDRVIVVHRSLGREETVADESR